MTTQVTATAPVAVDDPQVGAVACILLAFEKAAAAAVVFRPLARLGEDFVAATVMIDVGGGPLPFDLETARLAARCLRADPPFPGAADLADRLILAADQAEAQALRLMSALN